MRAKKLSNNLIAEIESSFDRERRGFLETLQRWLNRNLRWWRQEERDYWQLEWLATLDLTPYPIEIAILSPQEELDQLKRFIPDSLEEIAMRLNGMIWEGITLDANSNCNNCGAGMRIMEAREEGIPVLACKQCVWCQRTNGQRWEGDEILRPATTERVMSCLELWAPDITKLR